MPRLALQQVDVLDRDRAAVAEIDDENGKPDGGFRRRHREHDQLERHQDDDHVLAVEEDAENAEREQDRADGEVMAEPDGHDSPCPERTLTISIALALSRATWAATFWRLTEGLWRSVSTIAPIMATSSTTPA